MQNLGEIVNTVQRNCDISDARHAGDLSMCTFLMKMREYYRWENELPFSCALPKEDVGEWLKAREQMWQDLQERPFEPVPLEHGRSDPFDSEGINRELVPQGYIYSAGYGRFCKPHFFLGELVHAEPRGEYTVYVSSCEYARDLEAPPAMLQGRAIFVREESVRRFLWEKIEEWRWSRGNRAMGRALAAYGFIVPEASTGARGGSIGDAGGIEAALARMTRNEIEAMILHELGEGIVGERVGRSWPQMMSAIVRTKAEIMARAVRDLAADCLSTLPGLLRDRRQASIHFYFANFGGMRRELFPEALKAYESWLPAGEDAVLLELAERGARHWLAKAETMLDLASREGPNAAKTIEALLTAPAN